MGQGIGPIVFRIYRMLILPNTDFIGVFLLHQPQPIHLPAILCTAGDQIYPRGLNVAVAQHIGKLGDILAGTIINRGK